LALLTADDVTVHLKASRRRAPRHAVRSALHADPSIFGIDPLHLVSGHPLVPS
jgi:hypothetical protein